MNKTPDGCNDNLPILVAYLAATERSQAVSMQTLRWTSMSSGHIKALLILSQTRLLK